MQHSSDFAVKRGGVSGVVQPVLLFLVLLGVWELTCRVFGIAEFVVPAPSDIGRQLATNGTRILWHTGITVAGAAAGFLIANALSFGTAVFFTYAPVAERSAYPYLVALKSVPIVAVAPLITLWMGDGFGSKVAMAALITFFPMVVNATLGLQSADRRALDLMKVLGATDRQIFLKLRIPAALPYIASALKISAPLAVVGAIVAEIAGASSGIGYLILVAAYKVETPLMFACVLAAALSGLLFFGFAVNVEKWLTSHRGRRRTTLTLTDKQPQLSTIRQDLS